MEYQINMNEPAGVLPGACKRLGEAAFVAMAAFPVDPDQYRVVFARPGLLENADGKALSADETKEFVEKHLLLTFDQSLSIPGAKPVTVYADRQADPMNMSLNGNLGSGRAAYYGECFNLKGLGKTVLAISKDRNHSNGNLDLVSALWEAICSNVLHTNLRTGTSPVVAVINPVNDVEVPWREGRYPGGIIVRIDKGGELDRPTHLFQKNEAVKADQLRQIARNLGRQDAEKFIERILHGCWSAGNISIDGHMIDYDTVFAVRGRAPQWSYRPNWLSNFFGLEGPGQKKLLKAMVNHAINAEHLSYRDVCRQFDDARRKQLEQRFLDLSGIGADAGYDALPVSANDYSEIVTAFERLSMMMYPNFKATAPWEPENSSISLYDFSRFMRLFPILRSSGEIEPQIALSLLRNPHGRMIESTVSGMPESIVHALNRHYVVASDQHIQALDNEALQFISEYDRRLASWKQAHPEDWGKLVQRAYIVNEERSYMNCRPGNDFLVALTQHLAAEKVSNAEFSQLIELIIEACDRIPQPDPQGRCQADLRLFLNGFTSNLIAENGFFQPRLTILTSSLAPFNIDDLTSSRWEIEIEGVKNACSVEPDHQRLHIIGPKLPLAKLAESNVPESFRYFNQRSPFNLIPIERNDRSPVIG